MAGANFSRIATCELNRTAPARRLLPAIVAFLGAGPGPQMGRLASVCRPSDANGGYRRRAGQAVGDRSGDAQPVVAGAPNTQGRPSKKGVLVTVWPRRTPMAVRLTRRPDSSAPVAIAPLDVAITPYRHRGSPCHFHTSSIAKRAVAYHTHSGREPACVDCSDRRS